eukprot:gene15752-33261_t
MTAKGQHRNRNVVCGPGDQHGFRLVWVEAIEWQAGAVAHDDAARRMGQREEPCGRVRLEPCFRQRIRRDHRQRLRALPTWAYYREAGLDIDAVPAGLGRVPFNSASADLLERFKPKVVSFHFGLPDLDLLDRVKSWGSVVLASATTVEEAHWLEAFGADVIIAQGVEAGGHRGMFLTDDLTTQVGTFALLPQVVAAVSLPVIAAGGIADAAGVAAAMALGASGVQVGTAYLCSAEAPTRPLHRAALPRHAVARAIRHALADDAEITVRIVGEEEGRELNKSYRKKDYATNVLTFDYTRAPVVAADLVLCAPVIEREAKEQNKSLEEHYAHMLVHGTLHAQGWDHETSEADAEEMEAYETAILQELGFADPSGKGIECPRFGAAHLPWAVLTGRALPTEIRKQIVSLAAYFLPDGIKTRPKRGPTDQRWLQHMGRTSGGALWHLRPPSAIPVFPASFPTSQAPRTLPMTGHSAPRRTHPPLRTARLAQALLMVIPLVLAACGGGSGSDAPATGIAAPSGFAVGYGTKGYTFTWTASAGASRYELLEDPDGPAGPQPEVIAAGVNDGSISTVTHHV